MQDVAIAKLKPLKCVLEELNARRDSGLNNFSKEEPAVSRLLTALDDILNANTYDPGGLLDFLQCAVQKLPYSPLTHDPLTKVGQVSKDFPQKQDAARYWLICALCQTNALKQMLQLTLPMHDILTCFYVPHSVLLAPGFIDAFLTTLSGLHAHKNGLTTFSLDITALHLFDMKPQEVAVVRKKAHSMKKRDSVVKGRVPKSSSHLQVAPGTPGGPVEDELRIALPPFEGSSEREAAAASCTPRQPTATPRGATPRSGVTPRGHHHHHHGGRRSTVPTEDKEVQTNEEKEKEGENSKAEKAAEEKPFACTQTDQPAPSMTFADLCALERTLTERDRKNKASQEKIRTLEQKQTELTEDLQDKYTEVTRLLQALKSLYNDLFNDAREAQSARSELKIKDLNPIVPQLLQVAYGNATVLMPEATASAAASTSSPAAAVASSRPPTVGTATVNSSEGPGGGTAAAKRSEEDTTTSSGVDEREITNEGSTAWEVLDNPADVSGSAASQMQFQPQSAGSSHRDPARMRAQTQASNPPRVAAAASAGGGGPPTRLGSFLDRSAGSSGPFDPNVYKTNTPPAVAVGDVPLLVDEPIEIERGEQLKRQNRRCPGCSTVFSDPNDNVLFKVVQKAGNALHLQKPRRCHYCAKLYCHKCHSNKQAILPFRVFQRWDFSSQHVCNKDYEFLRVNFDQPIYHLRQLPAEMRFRSNIMKAMALREKMNKLGRIVVDCTKSGDFIRYLRTYYFSRPDYYSLSDFTKLRSGDAPQNLMNSIAGLPLMQTQEDLLVTLQAMYEAVRPHVNENSCIRCHHQCAMRCSICKDPQPVFMFEENGTVCEKCGNFYHVACFESMGCINCAAYK